ncbi:MAG: MacB-like periplasmic core domain protein [Gemmatimonadetes bacterium]|jgi:putative ABC transport system permease protein|nr:MacB-like periplasmic core domain protein [Gemmatimonadota bacterium]
MKFLPLVIANLKRHKLRTILTICSVALALFLFASLRTVTTTLSAGSEVSSAQRVIVQNSTAFVIPLPMSYANRLSSVPHVQSVTWANWFGGKYGDGKKFFAQFAIDPATYLGMYPEYQIPEDQKQAFLKERASALIGEGLARSFGWKVGDNVTLQGTIFPGDWTFTIRGIYHPTLKEYGDDQFMFHYDYLYEKYPDRVTPGWYILKIDDPAAAPAVMKTIDDQFRNSNAPTKTGTEKAFAAGFASMWGNVKLLMSTIGMAVVFAILLVTANAMMMNQRERTSEVAVMKTVGFSDRRVFGLVIIEAAVISLTGSVLGLGAATLLPIVTGFGEGGFLPGFHVTGGTLVIGATVALLLTVASGIFPAWQAAKLPVVQALRRVE